MNLYWSGKLVAGADGFGDGWPGRGGSAQAPSPTSSGREIFAPTAAGAPAGGLPRVRAAAQWVGQRGDEGRGTNAQGFDSDEILITLPEALPRDFTLEFDIVPKQCCNPEDLAFEGTATLSQSSGRRACSGIRMFRV